MENSPSELDNVSSPELDKSGKVTRHAINSAEQAHGIAVKLEKDNQERNRISAVVLKKYNGAQPHDPAALKANGEDYRSNAPTGFMSGIVDRITPAPIQAIDSARFLTSASLDSGSPEDEKKSEYFRLEVTKTIRGWDGWRDFLAALCQEDVLIGYAAPLNLNPYSPWPKMFRGDEVFFHDGTGQHARMVPALAAREDLLIHEFTNFIEDGKEIAEHAGWDFDACIKEINDALPKGSASSQDGDNARTAEDAIREANQGASYSGAKVIELYHTLAVEPDSKKVTHYITNRRNNHEQLFKKEERFERMEDICTLFTLQPGNGKYYSSKGTGRLLLNMHISIERDRNGMLDNLHLAGMNILVVPANTIPSLSLKPIHPIMVVSTDGKFEKSGIATNVKEYIEADNQVSKWAEQIVGSYLPGLRGDDGSPNITATEATIIANRDAQAKTAFLARFWGQFADLISQITRRLCDPETTDKAAKELQKKLKDEAQGNLTDEEIQKLANAPAAEVVMDLTQMHNEQIIRTYPTLVGNTSVDQDRLLSRYLSAAVNPQFAKDVQLDKQGIQALEIEGVSYQQLETEAILAGAPGMPVSPRHPHGVHLKTAFADMKAGIPKIAQSPTPEILDHLNAQLVHTKAHIETWKAQGCPPEELKPFEDAQKAFEQVLEQLASQMQKQSQEPKTGATMPQERPQMPATEPGDVSGMEAADKSKEPVAPSGAPSEKIITSWISKYEALPGPERQRLEQLGGLSVPRRGMPQPPERIRLMRPPARPMPQQAPPMQSAPASQPPQTEAPPQAEAPATEPTE